LASSLLEIESDDEIFRNIETENDNTVPIGDETFLDSSLFVESSRMANSPEEHHERTNTTQEQQHALSPKNNKVT
jgi:hypothetical protein